MKTRPISFRIDRKRDKALEMINKATKIPLSELIKQGLDRIIETYSIYISDANFRRELSNVMSDSEEYLKKLVDEN